MAQLTCLCDSPHRCPFTQIQVDMGPESEQETKRVPTPGYVFISDRCETCGRKVDRKEQFACFEHNVIPICNPCVTKFGYSCKNTAQVQIYFEYHVKIMSLWADSFFRDRVEKIWQMSERLRDAVLEYNANMQLSGPCKGDPAFVKVTDGYARAVNDIRLEHNRAIDEFKEVRRVIDVMRHYVQYHELPATQPTFLSTSSKAGRFSVGTVTKMIDKLVKSERVTEEALKKLEDVNRLVRLSRKQS